MIPTIWPSVKGKIIKTIKNIINGWWWWWVGRSQRTFRAVKIFFMILWWLMYVSIFLSKPIDYITPKGNFKAHYGEEGWVPKNWCFWTVVLEKILESPLDCKEIQPVHSEGNQPWDFFGRNDANWNSSTLATSSEELTHWKRLWCWEGLGAGGEGDNRGWDGWMASLTRGTWVWVNSGSWWWTGRPGVLRFMGLQRSDTTEWLNWNELMDCG